MKCKNTRSGGKTLGMAPLPSAHDAHGITLVIVVA